MRPHLEFASTAWSPWTQLDKECLEKVQERAIRMVSGLASDKYEERLVELGMVSLEERRHMADTGMQQVHKILHGLYKVDKNTWFEMASGQQDRR